MLESKIKKYLKESTNPLHTIMLLRARHKELTRQYQKLAAEQKKIISPALLDDAYYLAVSDHSFEHPLSIDRCVAEIMLEKIPSHKTKKALAQAIYSWIESNISYGEHKKTTPGYKHSASVLRDKEGVCGEMGYVFITLARLRGLRSQFVLVKKDYQGKKVHHACANVHLDEGMVLVDPAYHQFDVKHRSYKVLTDREMFLEFSAFNLQEAGKSWLEKFIRGKSLYV